MKRQTKAIVATLTALGAITAVSLLQGAVNVLVVSARILLSFKYRTRG